VAFFAILSQKIPRNVPSRRAAAWLLVAVVAAPVPVALAASQPSHPEVVVDEWQARAPLPLPRTEVASAVVRSEIAVAGGFNADGSTSARVDAYAPATDRWRRLPDLPVTTHHAMAAAYRGKLYVVGGYLRFASPLARAFVFEGATWRALPSMPAPRAAAGAAVVGGKLYVVGGVGPNGLARRAFALDLATRRWSSVPGPAPREHLAVTAARGRIYALGGRLAGIDTNLRTVQSWAPGERAWRSEPALPSARGGTGASAVAGRLIVSVGGEEPAGTIASVYGLDVVRRQWERLPDLRTPRHGLGVVTFGTTVYAVGGGPRPGLFVSGANEALRFAP
jgi:hypothetical protein